MKREIRYDLLRIVSCFAVVLLHVSSGYWGIVDLNGNDFLVMTVYNSFTRFGVPVFFMLSGLFLLDPQKEMTARKWGIRVVKLVGVFYLWSTFYAFQSVIFNGVKNGWDSVTGEMWVSAWTRFIMGHSHMWFLMDLLGFYLLLPVFRKICEDIRVLGYFLLLWVIVRFVITTMIPNIGQGFLLAKVNSLHLYFLMGYIGFFMGGYFLQKIDIPKRYRYILYICGAGAIGFTIVMTLHDCRATQTYEERWFSASNVNVLIFSIATFVFYKYIAIPKRLSDSKLIPAMARSTFFVYMVHPFLLDKLGLLGIKVISFPVYLSIPILSVGIFAAGMLGGWIAGKIPVIGKWICWGR